MAAKRAKKAPARRARNAEPTAAEKKRRSTAAKKAAATRKRNAAAAKRKGSSVESRAKAAGAKGGRLTASKLALRNALIVQRATADRWPWNMVAEEAGISEKQCRRVVEDAGSTLSPFEATPTELIEEWATGYRQSISTLTVLAAGADNTAAAVGAIKGANDARDKLITLMQAVGHVPHDLGVLKVARDIERVATTMLDAVDQLKAGDISPDELAQVFYDLAGIPRAPEQLPAGDP